MKFIHYIHHVANLRVAAAINESNAFALGRAGKIDRAAAWEARQIEATAAARRLERKAREVLS